MVKQKKIPDGYKMSEVGVIPCEWEVKKLGDLTNKIGSGITPRGGVRVYKTKGRPFVRSQNVKSGYLDLRDIVFIDQETHNTFSGTELRNNDVLLNITGASIGRSAVVNEKIIGGNVNQHVCILRPNKENLDSIYLCEYLISVQGQKFIDSFQSGGNREGLNFKQIASISIPIPKIKEQKSIATALSDMDDLILSMKKLIDKKKLIKQGAMQELLSGKKRLDGFSEAWLNRKFNEVCWFQEGPGLRNWQFTRNGMKVINVTNIENGILNLSKTDRYIKNSEFEKVYKHFGIDENDIVVASSGNSYGKVAVVRKQDLPLMMNTSVIRFKASNELNYGFLLQFLKSNLFIDQINILITGGAQPNFGPAHLNKIYIYLPLQIEEQKAIAKILSDMDQEIEKLEIKLDKYKQIKKGMMEELLTGKRRLI